MIKIKKIAVLVLCAAAVSGCFRDKGNYDYVTLPRIGITAPERVYVTQFENLKPAVEIDFGKESPDDYLFDWRLWSDDLEESVRKNIAQTRELDYKVTEMPGKYSLILAVQNKLTGVKTYKTIKVEIQGTISEGWMVLHEKDGKTDFDLIMTPYLTDRFTHETILTDVYESVNGEPLEGRGVKIANYFSRGRYQYVTILTEEGGVRLSAFTMQKQYDLETLMLDGKPLRPQNYIYYPYMWCYGNGEEVLISDGRLYINGLVETGFVEPIPRDGETYQPSKWLPRWIEYYYGIFYDESRGRFYAIESNMLRINELPKAVGEKFDWNDMHATMRYMETGFNYNEYAVMKDWYTGKSILYVFNFEDRRNNFAIDMYTTDNCPGFEQAEHFAIAQRGPVFYYTVGNDVYLYDYSGTNSASRVLTAEPGETISQIKIFKSSVDRRYFPNHPFDSKVLIMSTHNASTGEGKVYMYYINATNGAIDLGSRKVYGGFGEILDMEYNFPKLQ